MFITLSLHNSNLFAWIIFYFSTKPIAGHYRFCLKMIDISVYAGCHGFDSCCRLHLLFITTESGIWLFLQKRNKIMA